MNQWTGFLGSSTDVPHAVPPVSDPLQELKNELVDELVPLATESFMDFLARRVGDDQSPNPR